MPARRSSAASQSARSRSTRSRSRSARRHACPARRSVRHRPGCRRGGVRVKPGMTGRERGRIHEQPEYSLNRAAKAITSRGVGALQALLVSGGFGAAHAASMCYALRYGCHHTQDKRYGTACSHYESRSLPARPITSTRGTLPGRRGAHRRMSSGRSSVPTGVTTSKLEQFRRRYPPQIPRKKGPPHESVMIPPGNSLRFLPRAPVSDVEFGVPPRDTEDRGCNRYLWVIDTRGIPYLIERPMSILDRNCPKHTNLTGGGPAYIGGELWFAGTKSMFVSGGSGRFPPLGEDQLAAAVEVFSSFSYVVKSLGWDSVAGRAIRVLQEH